MFKEQTFSTIPKKARILIILYFIAVLGIISIYLFEQEHTILFHTLLFVIVLFINRLSVDFYIHKEQMMNYIYFTELCFLIYLFCVFFYENNYFTMYKLLIVPSIVLSIVQLFKSKQIKN